MSPRLLSEVTCDTAMDQAESRARPLPRRRLRIMRPARVFIRARKPCLRLRRRLFGWKVLLLTTDLFLLDRPLRPRLVVA